MGATEAITAAMLGLCEPGEEVLAFDPTYDSYGAAATMTGARLVPVPLHPPEWRFDPDELAPRSPPKTRAILVNSPHNPTGRVLTRAELQQIADVVHRARPDRDHRRGLRAPRLRRARAHPAGDAARDGGAHADDLLAGQDVQRDRLEGRLGDRAGARSSPRVRAAKQFLTFAGATPFQHAGAAALRMDDGWYAAFAQELQAKRDHLCAGLEQAGLDVLEPQGTYFANADVGTDATAFARELPHRAGVVAIPTARLQHPPGRAARPTCASPSASGPR